MVTCVALSKRFADCLAVDAVDLTLQRGEVLALLGPNGAGKTTMVRMLCGLIAPSSGAISIKGHAQIPGDESFRRAIGILTEHPGLYERLTLRQNLTFHARLQGMSDSLLARRAEELLRRFALWDRRDDRVAGFSKGMKQKAAIIRALLHDPEILFLDEPTSGLDPEAAREVRAMIAALRQQGRTVLLTTHRLAEAEELADRVAVLQSRLIALDTVAGLRDRIYGRRVAVRLGDRHDDFTSLCASLPGVKSVEREGDKILVALSDPDHDTPELVRALVSAGAAIFELGELKQSLESVYLQLIAKEPRS